MNIEDLQSMTDAYLECALWSSHAYLTGDEDAEPVELEGYYPSETFEREARQDCRAFIVSNMADLSAMDAEQAGHDFWLTRNGHGAGFWDRGLGKLGERLTSAAWVYGEVDLYVGDDETVYAG